MHQTPDDATKPAGDAARVTRRLFLKGSSAAVAGAGAGLAAVGVAGVGSDAAAAPANGRAGRAVSANIPVQFFNTHEAATVEAMAARIFPGTPEDPGAREAGVVDYIDSALAGPYGYGQQTYRQGPYLVPSSAPVAPSAEISSRLDLYQTVEIDAELAPRYGYQSFLTPQEFYRRGVIGLDRFTNAGYGKNFVDLTEAEQDEALTALATGEATGFDDPSGQAFFVTVRTHTLEGMFADPMYGGNRDMVGWKLVGFPGAQVQYSADEMLEGSTKEPMSLAQLHGFEMDH
jgi:gluconate 2-dehydrogenase gamma chain